MESANAANAADAAEAAMMARALDVMAETHIDEGAALMLLQAAGADVHIAVQAFRSLAFTGGDIGTACARAREIATLVRDQRLSAPESDR